MLSLPTYSTALDEWQQFIEDVTELGRRWPATAGPLRDELLAYGGLEPDVYVDLRSADYPDVVVRIKPNEKGKRAFMAALKRLTGAELLPRVPTPFQQYDFWVSAGRPVELSALPAEELPAA